MTTEQQLAANRANAQKSTGPKTPGGKYISSRNGATHGMFANSVLLPGESGERFRRLVASYITRFKPVTPDELDLIETMAVNRWRLQRVWALETAGFVHEQRAQSVSTGDEDPATKYALVHRALSHPPRSLESLSRYEVRCDRQYHRAADRLRQLCADRIERGSAKEIDEKVEKEKMRIRTQSTEQNKELIENHKPNRTGGRTGDKPGSNQRAKPTQTQRSK